MTSPPVRGSDASAPSAPLDDPGWVEPEGRTEVDVSSATAVVVPRGWTLVDVVDVLPSTDVDVVVSGTVVVVLVDVEVVDVLVVVVLVDVVVVDVVVVGYVVVVT